MFCRIKLNKIQTGSEIHDPSGKKPWHNYESGKKVSAASAQKYFVDRFKSCHKRAKPPLIRCACALESESIDEVFREMENAIIKDYMKQSIFSSIKVSATAQDKMSKFKRAGIKAALKK